MNCVSNSVKRVEQDVVPGWFGSEWFEDGVRDLGSGSWVLMEEGVAKTCIDCR